MSAALPPPQTQATSQWADSSREPCGEAGAEVRVSPGQLTSTGTTQGAPVRLQCVDQTVSWDGEIGPLHGQPLKPEDFQRRTWENAFVALGQADAVRLDPEVRTREEKTEK